MADERVRLPLVNLVEASILGDILNQDGVPHFIRSYQDRAYGALWQFQQGWGFVEMPPRFAGGVEAVLSLIRRSSEDIARSFEEDESETDDELPTFPSASFGSPSGD
jgi:hypothetical protein